MIHNSISQRHVALQNLVLGDWWAEHKYTYKKKKTSQKMSLQIKRNYALVETSNPTDR